MPRLNQRYTAGQNKCLKMALIHNGKLWIQSAIENFNDQPDLGEWLRAHLALAVGKIANTDWKHFLSKVSETGPYYMSYDGDLVSRYADSPEYALDCGMEVRLTKGNDFITLTLRKG